MGLFPQVATEGAGDLVPPEPARPEEESPQVLVASCQINIQGSLPWMMGDEEGCSDGAAATAAAPAAAPADDSGFGQ